MLSETDWEDLNAYVDGELDRRAAAAVEKRLAREPELAAELERVRMLKAALGGLRPAVPPPPSPRFPVKRAAAVAASLIVAVGLSFGAYELLTPPAAPAVLQNVHEAFAARSYVVEQDGAIALSAGTTIGALKAPDLTASRLRLVDIRVSGAVPEEHVAMHYRGPRGCRVTLVAAPASAAGSDEPIGLELVHRWSTRSARFVLMADGMDPRRFDAIAAFAEAETRRTEDAGDLRLALVETTAAARPCV